MDAPTDNMEYTWVIILTKQKQQLMARLFSNESDLLGGSIGDSIDAAEGSYETIEQACTDKLIAGDLTYDTSARIAPQVDRGQRQCRRHIQFM